MFLSAERETKKPNHKPVSVKSSVKSTLKSIYRDKSNEYTLFDGENTKGTEIQNTVGTRNNGPQNKGIFADLTRNFKNGK